MIRTVVIPDNTDLHLSIPKDYIGKEIEVFLYAKDEIKDLPKQQKIPTLADFIGSIDDATYSVLKEQTEKARSEWDRNF